MMTLQLWALLILFCAVPPVCWLLLSRDRATRISVGIALAMCAVSIALMFAEWIYLTSKAEAFFSYPLAAATLIGLGLWHERRKLGRRENRAADEPARLVLLVFFGFALLCGLPSYVMLNGEPFVPDNRDVLPLPSDLKVVTDKHECGSGACYRSLVIASRSRLKPTQVANRLRTHLGERGWKLKQDRWDCRRLGVWFDRTGLCVSVHVEGPHAVVRLEGSRAWAGG
jgi:hypothetical protein